MGSTFEQRLAEGVAAPVDGWEFSWFEGRATEERPTWGYSDRVVPRMASAASVLDIQTGGGELLAELLVRSSSSPRRVVATESFPPNVGIAAAVLARCGVSVIEAAEGDPLPFVADRFDLVISRHPTVTVWPEIARVLEPGATYLSQQVGPGSNRELTDFMMGPQPVSDRRSAERAGIEAEQAGLEVVDLRQASLEVTFLDVGAVVAFLRKVPWTVPGFSAEAYRERLADLHEQIARNGPFVSHAQRFLIEAVKRPGGRAPSPGAPRTRHYGPGTTATGNTPRDGAEIDKKGDER